MEKNVEIFEDFIEVMADCEDLNITADEVQSTAGSGVIQPGGVTWADIAWAHDVLIIMADDDGLKLTARYCLGGGVCFIR